MEWICLAVSTIVWSFGCWLSFSEESKQRWWYIPLGILCGMCTNFLWFLAMKYVPCKQKSYILTVCWEAAIVTIYFGAPLLFFGVKIDRWTAAAIALVVAGILMLKLRP
jgi:drug/metabolite transporter (DMT)-like permease